MFSAPLVVASSLFLGARDRLFRVSAPGLDYVAYSRHLLVSVPLILLSPYQHVISVCDGFQMLFGCLVGIGCLAPLPA
jgi:hypothetical protein